ncbi:MAG: DnaD domain protein [Firmicutes bacterium]|nr:DnaD domain protein [Bacillota bacterium]
MYIGSGKMNMDNKKFVIETVFLKETLKHNLTLNEFIILMYFDNEYELTFDVKKVSKSTCLSEKDVLNAFGSLLDKKLIILNSIKDESGKLIDKVSLENLYNGIKDNATKSAKEKEKNDLFAKFQANYGHSLSGMDYEIIKAWLENGFSEELILGALDEANYNGVTTLRYIDKILFEWNKKGFKKMEDVNNHMKSRSTHNDSKITYESSVLEYNWLDEE